MALLSPPRPKNRLRPDAKLARMAREKPPVRRRPDFRHKEAILKAKERVGWWLMFPFGILSVFAFVDIFFKAGRSGLFTSSETVCFLVGAVVWMAMFPFVRQRFSLAYVFAHEMTHIVSAKLCGATVYDWKVSRGGGWVDTSKSNTFISLSPYIVPLYTVAVVLAFGVAGLFADLSQVHALHLGGVEVPFNASKVLHYLVGLTWAFHLSFTISVMREEQGDLVRNGQFFSVWLITLVNLYLVAFFLISASPNLHWSDVWSSITGMAVNTASSVYYGVTWVGTHAWAEVHDMLGALKSWRPGP